MPAELPKAYDAKNAQQKWLKFWEERGYFHSEPDSTKKPYTIVIPPPNVTGALHMGHALNNTLQDVLIRWRRMQGYNALWMPGTDHAGIATQAVVEKRILADEKKTRHDLGREELVKRIWQWKDQYEKRILGQLREIGASCDWQRTRFTLDPICAKAVRETFFRMFRDGYIYRGKRLVNWDVALQTSVADDETYTEDTKGGFWTFKYPILDEQPAMKEIFGKSITQVLPDGTLLRADCVLDPEDQDDTTGDIPKYISFSTTRPETMLGDTAVCVHPDDKRYTRLIGRRILSPLTGKYIHIIADGILADPELGTGCVKVTPAHDPNDYACWQRNPQIDIINILNPDGTINAAGGKYAGMDRYKAREAIIAEMESLGLFEGKEDRVIPLKYSDRSKTVIEPYLSDQWFVKMSDRDDGKPGLAQLAIDAVTSGKVKFHPERYKDTYISWLSEKRDWCVSRQLWWGHRIPVWSKTFLDEAEYESTLAVEGGSWSKLSQIAWTTQENDESHSIHICINHDDSELIRTLESDGFRQSEDVLDTWFSSALWPHSTLGWPEPMPELKYYYPTSSLVTSRDIISLWVARMVLTGLYNVGDIPFKDVYIHPQLQDAFGERMSKTTGNGIDPLDIVERYGTDAMRYLLVTIAGDTQDSRMPVSNVCPFCDTLIPIKQEHMRGRTKKLKCPGNPAQGIKCGKEFRPGGPWHEEAEIPTAKQASERFEIGRNFANKLWNATRFLLMNLEGYTPGALKLEDLPTEDRWIISRLTTTANAVTDALESYKFSDVGRLLYEFTWSEFCDWYIEMSKGRLHDTATRPLAQRVLVGVLDGILRLVHPVMPFVTESLWQALNEAAPERGLLTPTKAEESVVIAKWPTYPMEWVSSAVEARFARMQDLVRGVREVRNRYQVEPKVKLDVAVKCTGEVASDFQSLSRFVGQLAGVGAFLATANVTKPKQAGTVVRPDFEAYVSLAGLIDVPAEMKRLEKQIADSQKQLTGIQGKLANESYVKNAPAEVVEETRAKAAELQNQIRVLEGNLKDLQEA